MIIIIVVIIIISCISCIISSRIITLISNLRTGLAVEVDLLFINIANHVRLYDAIAVRVEDDLERQFRVLSMPGVFLIRDLQRGALQSLDHHKSVILLLTDLAQVLYIIVGQEGMVGFLFGCVFIQDLLHRH